MEYIAADNIDAADRWVGTLFDAFEALARTPGMGHKRDDLTQHAHQTWVDGGLQLLGGLFELLEQQREIDLAH